MYSRPMLYLLNAENVVFVNSKRGYTSEMKTALGGENT